jgi:uncharacterized membrane protein YkvI
MILLIPVLINFKRFIKSKKHVIMVSIISGSIIFVMAISVFFLLSNINIFTDKIQMPVVYVVNKDFSKYIVIYGIVILVSIFTTSISVGISFLEDVVKDKRCFPQIAGIMCITSCIISNFGFSNLVKFLFPIIGYLGIVQIFVLLFKKIDKFTI